MECPTVPWDCEMGWTIYAISEHLWRGSYRPDIELTSINLVQLFQQVHVGYSVKGMDIKTDDMVVEAGPLQRRHPGLDLNSQV